MNPETYFQRIYYDADKLMPICSALSSISEFFERTLIKEYGVTPEAKAAFDKKIWELKENYTYDATANYLRHMPLSEKVAIYHASRAGFSNEKKYLRRNYNVWDLKTLEKPSLRYNVYKLSVKVTRSNILEWLISKSNGRKMLLPRTADYKGVKLSSDHTPGVKYIFRIDTLTIRHKGVTPSDPKNYAITAIKHSAYPQEMIDFLVECLETHTVVTV